MKMARHIKLIFVFIIAFLVIGILAYFIVGNLSNESNELDNSVGFVDDTNGNFVDGELPDSPRFPSGRVVGGAGGGGGSSGGGGGGGGAGGSAGVSANGANCFGQQIAYALKDFKQSSDCNEFQGNVCVKKSLNCSLDVYNLDDNTAGVFGIRFNFLDEGAAFDSLLKEFSVAPSEYKKFEGFLEVESSGESGRANKELSCSFNTEQVPKEEICS